MTKSTKNLPVAAAAAMRLDKWLWAARFYKTRSLATEEIDKGRINVNAQQAKPSRDLRIGDTVVMRQGPVQRTIVVMGLSMVRGPAPQAQALYEETADSIAKRLAQIAERRAEVSVWGERKGRPTKRERREVEKWQRSD